MKTKEKRIQAVTGCLFIIIFCVVFFMVYNLISKITLYSDDYFYASVFRNGLVNFFEITKWHYLNFNGRAFVHFVAEIVMAFDTKVYAIVAPIMLSVIFALGVKVQVTEMSLKQLFPVVAIGMISIIALPVKFLNSSLLWMSAAFNYVFPVCVLFLMIWVFNCYIEKQRIGGIAFLLLFLAGASTEQCGLAAIVCVVGMSITAIFHNRFKLHKGILAILCVCMGYFTVVFSPATWVRVDNEVSSGILSIFNKDVFCDRFSNYMQYLTGKQSIPCLFVVFSTLTVIHWCVTKKGYAILLSGIPMAIVYIMSFLFDWTLVMEIFPLIYYGGVAFIYLLDDEMRMSGLLIVGMLASQFIMLCSTTATYRTILPAIFIIVSISLALFVECLKKISEGVLFLGAIVIIGINMNGYISNLNGYSANALINDKNIEALTDLQGDVIKISLDYNADYRYHMYFDSVSYLYHGMEYYGVSDDTKITYSSESQNVSGLYGNGTYGLPAFEQNGVLYLPLICATQLCGGGEGDWSHSEGGTIIWIDDLCYLIKTNGELYIWNREKEEKMEKVKDVDVASLWYTFYMPAEMFRELFGITWKYNVAENIYYLNR